MQPNPQAVPRLAVCLGKLPGCQRRGSGRSVGNVLSAVHLADLIRRVEDQLGRFGIAGRVELDGTTLRLTGHGRSVVITFMEVESFPAASAAQQARMLDWIVREFARVRRAENQSTASRSHWLEWLRPALTLALLAVAIALAWKWLGAPARDAVVTLHGGHSPLASVPSMVAKGNAPSTQAPVNAADSCQRVQSRIATGGSVSVLDVDGWVVELMLLARDPTFAPTSPKLDAFFAKSDDPSAIRHLAWPEDEELSALDSPDSFIIVSKEPLVDVISGTKAGMRIVWSGKYVTKYFDEPGRLRMQRLAAAIYEATGASHAALYARCAVGATHQIGSWFRSNDLSGAVLSMLAAMGLYAEVAHVEGADPRTASTIEQRRIWDGIIERAARLDKQRIALGLSETGGMLAARPGHWQTITFPFQDANRATRASLGMARLLGVAPRH